MVLLYNCTDSLNTWAPEDYAVTQHHITNNKMEMAISSSHVTLQTSHIYVAIKQIVQGHIRM